MLAHVPSRVRITVSAKHCSDTEEMYTYFYCIIPQKLMHIFTDTVEQLSYQCCANSSNALHLCKFAAQMVRRRCSRCSQSMLSRCRYSTLLYRFPDTRVCVLILRRDLTILNSWTDYAAQFLWRFCTHLLSLDLVFEAQAQRRFSADEPRDLQICIDKGALSSPTLLCKCTHAAELVSRCLGPRYPEYLRTC
jgi:hypothetical protein